MTAAASIIHHATTMRETSPHATSREILDLLIEPLRGRRLEFGQVSPLDAFGQIVADAFDGIMQGPEWAEFLTNPRTQQISSSLWQIWQEAVWPRFLQHYDLDDRGRPSKKTSPDPGATW